jgi:hypothetical protein
MRNKPQLEPEVVNQSNSIKTPKLRVLSKQLSTQSKRSSTAMRKKRKMTTNRYWALTQTKLVILTNCQGPAIIAPS